MRAAAPCGEWQTPFRQTYGGEHVPSGQLDEHAPQSHEPLTHDPEAHVPFGQFEEHAHGGIVTHWPPEHAWPEGHAPFGHDPEQIELGEHPASTQTPLSHSSGATQGGLQPTGGVGMQYGLPGTHS